MVKIKVGEIKGKFTVICLSIYNISYIRTTTDKCLILTNKKV